ncbi:hypothetical protein MVEN_01094200 [Mycena venus]|uniref:F-box domain-containing protein n=1 Tax=Mycena venus TaxID=2733690 RepID=A0A8H6Y6B0_9AGAR|nr:hypothetical protein MVEN_01094200 [Mycena venus]
MYRDAFSSALLPNTAQISQLHNLLRSNALPPETSSLQRMISASPAELERYDSEIERLHKELDRLKSERHTLASYAKGCRSVLAPIRRLPTELLAEIFEMCSPTYTISDQTTTREEVDRVSKRHLRQLAQVSSFWYNIAMGTPKLWSTIVLDTALWNRCILSAKTLFSLLESSLKLGGNHPLTIELLSQHAWRWEDVYFWSDIDSSRYLTSAKGNLDRLEKLYISAEWRGVDIFRLAPLLTEIIFCGKVENVPHLPWPQIQTLTYIGEAYMVPFLSFSLLVKAHNVATALFDIDLRNAQFDAPWQLVSSNVQFITFELAVHDLRVVGRMFDSLTLPHLKSFNFTPRPDGRPPLWSTESFLSLAERSSFQHNLTRLEIDATATDEDLLRCLPVLPQLEELVISDSTSHGENILITDTLLQGLVYKSGSTPLIPRLDFLCLTFVLGFNDSLFVEVVNSRLDDYFNGLAAAFEVHLWWLPACRREASSQMLAQLLSLVSAGDLAFKSGPASSIS